MSERSCLVVDGSRLTRQLLIFALRTIKDLSICEAEDGIDALRKLAVDKYDLVITDLDMPILDGVEFVSRIRSDEVHKDALILVLSTKESREDRDRALILGATAYITKPVHAFQVIAKAKELLEVK